MRFRNWLLALGISYTDKWRGEPGKGNFHSRCALHTLPGAPYAPVNSNHYKEAQTELSLISAIPHKCPPQKFICEPVNHGMSVVTRPGYIQHTHTMLL